MSSQFLSELDDHITVMKMVSELEGVVEQLGEQWLKALNNGGKILLMGNGGSAADAQHIAAELVGRYMCERKGLAAIALTTDTSILTAVGNDYGYDAIFSRQVEALASPQDIIVAYSTSGNSSNVLAAVKTAQTMGCYTSALTGESGGQLKAIVDTCICVPSAATPRIQEAHAFIGHMLCAAVDAEFPA
jgi:D-sedoheptulose 7-phosphate isomerase